MTLSPTGIVALVAFFVPGFYAESVAVHFRNQRKIDWQERLARSFLISLVCQLSVTLVALVAHLHWLTRVVEVLLAVAVNAETPSSVATISPAAFAYYIVALLSFATGYAVYGLDARIVSLLRRLGPGDLVLHVPLWQVALQLDLNAEYALSLWLVLKSGKHVVGTLSHFDLAEGTKDKEIYLRDVEVKSPDLPASVQADRLVLHYSDVELIAAWKVAPQQSLESRWTDLYRSTRSLPLWCKLQWRFHRRECLRLLGQALLVISLMGTLILCLGDRRFS